jgi:hypothetical protein
VLSKLMYVLGVTVVALLALAVANAFNIAAARDINHTLLDCVNLTGNCGRQNAAQQAKIVDQVKEYNLIGFYCIRTNPGPVDPKGEAFLKCMERLYPGGPTLSER